MRKVLLALLATTAMVSSAHATDYGVRESTAWFGELVHKWETTTKDDKAAVRQEITDGAYNAQGIEGEGHHASYGWCNEAVVWAMDKVDMFDNVEVDHPGFSQMRGRHFSTHYNDKVTQSFNHDDTFNWDNVPIGTVALMDWASNPSDYGNLGLDHTTTFMGKLDDDWGWFLGGNQSGRLQPKLYRLDQMTHGSTFNEQGADVKKHYYDNVEEMARIKVEDGTWTKSNVSGWGWGTKHTLPKWYGFTYSSLMSKQWNQHKIPIQKFENGDNVVYVQTNDAMEVYEGQIIRTHDYYDHVEINDMKNHIGQFGMYSTKIQRDFKWWDSRTNQDSQTFRSNHENGSQWHDRVYTAKAIREALDTQVDRTINSSLSTANRDIGNAAMQFVDALNGVGEAREEHYDYTLARELYTEYGVEYYDEDQTLMSDLYNTQ